MHACLIFEDEGSTLLLMHVGMAHVFTLIKSYYINIDRGGVKYKHINAPFVI
jgi:hypothetical protein